MPNIFCSKTFEKAIKEEINLSKEQDEKNFDDWSAHIIKIDTKKFVIMVHHQTLLNLVFEFSKDFQRKFLDTLSSEIGKYQQLNLDDQKKLILKLENWTFFQKTKLNEVNYMIRNLSSLIKNFAALDEKIESFDNEESIKKFIKLIPR